MDKLKYVKLENEDGSYSSSIPLAVDSNYVDVNGTTLTAALATKADAASVNSSLSTIEAEISGLASGSPKGVYETTAALVSANPDTGVYIVTADGHIYSWTKNGSSAIDLGTYQATEIPANSVSLSKLNNKTNGTININNFEVTGYTDGYPKVIIDTENTTITLKKGGAFLFNHFGWILTSSFPADKVLDYSGVYGSAGTKIIYYDTTDNTLKYNNYNGFDNKEYFAYDGSHNKFILMYIYFNNKAEILQINAPVMMQSFIYHTDDSLWTTESGSGKGLMYGKLFSSYFTNTFDNNNPYSTIHKIVQNGSYVYDAYLLDKIKINYDTTNQELSWTAESGSNPVWHSKGSYESASQYNSTFDMTNCTNSTVVIYIDRTEKKIKVKPLSGITTYWKEAYQNNCSLLAIAWVKNGGGGFNWLLPISSQFDNNFYVDDVQYVVQRTNNRVININNNTPTSYDISDIGHLNKQDIGSTDYSHIILYGQSLSMGWEAPEVITTTPVDNCYMVGSSPMINHGNDGTLVLNPLRAVKWSSGGEQPIVALTNSFATLYNDNHSVPQKFIGTNCGEGGRSIERLMKQCTNGTNYYTTEFLDCITSAKAAVDAENKTISCPAIFYMQGEYNYVSTTDAGLTPGTDATTDKDQYKAYLLQLKNDMQADIMSTYGQTKKPLFFVYQVAGSYINRRDMSITMAQIEFAQENDDVFLMNSTYGMPDYTGGHLSTNGYRWYGEMMAKSMYQVFENKKQWNGLELANIQIDEKNVLCDFRAPVLPLVFDDWTKEARTQNGFKIFKNNSEITITGMSIVDNRVILITNTDLTTGTIEITYAGQGVVGSGNLRDSDEFNSMYTYYDDRESSPSKREAYTPKDKNGNYIYGKKYPMYNWANHFYVRIENS